MRWLSAVRFGAFLTGLLGPWSRLAAAQSVEFKAPVTERYDLQNGLHVVLAPDPRSLVAAVVVRYEVGQAHDPKTHPGLAHLLEHATFRGSSHLRPLEGMSILSELGAGYNAVTDLEQTTYYTELKSAGLETALWLESERMGFALGGIDQAGLSAEQRVVESELRERGRSLKRRLSKLWLNELYGEAHPFVLADDELDAVRDVALPGLQWFFQRAYRPDNATLVLSGGFAREQGRALVDKYFGPLRNPKVAKVSLRAPPPKLCRVQKLSIEHNYLFGRSLWLTWPGPPITSAAEQQAADGVAKALDLRLEDALVTRSADASSVSVHTLSFRSHSLFVVEIELFETTTPTAVQAAALAEARKLATTPLSDSEVRSVRASLISNEVFAQRSGLPRALDLARGVDRAQASPLALTAAQLTSTARPLAGPVLVLEAHPGGKWAHGTEVVSSEKTCR